ncbi:MAG: ATP-binding protein, partial [Thermoanaerobaculia bacterium]|nr:ATP-binding protein [Thermoanaerobaculia bacterium]
TRKYYAMTGPILETLAKGDTLVIDELDSKLHPNLVCKLVEIFNSKERNPYNAQLIFNTHDTNLLNSGVFRRDQIWFTEKDRYGAATLYALSDIKNVRDTDKLEDNYIQGKYGAIPYLGDFDK